MHNALSCKLYKIIPNKIKVKSKAIKDCFKMFMDCAVVSWRGSGKVAYDYGAVEWDSRTK
jgi:hypothetical protein